MRSRQKLLPCLIQHVSADSNADQVPDIRAGIPLQSLVKTTVRLTVPLQSMEVYRGTDIQRGPMLEQSVPKELHPMEETHTGIVEEIQPVRRNTACEKDPHWRSLWRAVFQTVSLVGPHAGAGEEH